MKVLLATLAAFSLVLSSGAAEEKPTDFIRVDEDSSAARLQTGITRYRKGDATVDLVGAVHIGDLAYYQSLGKKFETYDKVLFEMVGDEKAIAAKIQAAAGKAPRKDAGALTKIYASVAKMLGLVGQMESIDYSRKNFVHADITMEEFKKLQTEKGESLLTLMAEAESSGVKEPDTLKLVQALLSGNSNLAKLAIVHTLGSGDDQIGGFAGGKSVIIGDRNAKAIQVMDAELKPGSRSLAIFYGAAHFPDMEKRLVEKGFRKVSHEWLTAWNIPKPAAKVPAPEKK